VSMDLEEPDDELNAEVVRFDEALTIQDDVDYFANLDQQESMRMHFSPSYPSPTAPHGTGTVYCEPRDDSTCSILSNVREAVDQSGSTEIRDDIIECIEGDEGSPAVLSVAVDVIDIHYSHCHQDDEASLSALSAMSTVHLDQEQENEVMFSPNDRPLVEWRMKMEEEKGKEMWNGIEQWIKRERHFSDIDWTSDEEEEYYPITGSTVEKDESDEKSTECTCVGGEALDEEEEIETNVDYCGGVISAILPSKVKCQS